MTAVHWPPLILNWFYRFAGSEELNLKGDQQHRRRIYTLFSFCRDSIFRLSLMDLNVLEKAPWFASNEKIQLCQDKGQSDNDCHNFIKVLLSNGKRLFTCGTNAFAPECTWREVGVRPPLQRFVFI